MAGFELGRRAEKKSKKGLLFKRGSRNFDASSRIRTHFGGKTGIPKKMFQPSGLANNRLYNKLIKPEGLTKKGSGSFQRAALAKTTAKLIAETLTKIRCRFLAEKSNES